MNDKLDKDEFSVLGMLMQKYGCEVLIPVIIHMEREHAYWHARQDKKRGKKTRGTCHD